MPRSVNTLHLIGHVGGDPEVREVGPNNRMVANFSIATSPPWNEEKTEWHRCAAWGKLAEIIRDYVEKGDRIYLQGRLQYSEWTDDAGQDRKSAEINVDEVTLLGSSSGPSAKVGSSTDTPGDGELPF